MPRTVKTTVYKLNELSDAAKDNARTWYRESALHDDDWYDCVFEDFEQVCEILGVTLGTRPVSLMMGGTRQKPSIYFTGFWSQGDGASYKGCFAYKKSADRRIREYAPWDTELHRIADALRDVQRRNFYQLYGDIRLRPSTHCHEYTMDIRIWRESPAAQDVTADAEETVTEALRDLARWLYRQLEREYEYLSSDEVVDEGIVANDYTFTDAGLRFG